MPPTDRQKRKLPIGISDFRMLREEDRRFKTDGKPPVHRGTHRSRGHRYSETIPGLSRQGIVDTRGV